MSAPGMFAISDITVGTRHRRDLGDIQDLARSIDEASLLHPIVVNSNGVLIAGQRRLEACRLLGWSEVPVRIVDIGAIVRGESIENFKRKDFTLTEKVAIGRTLEAAIKAAASERQRKHAATAPGKHSGKVSTSESGRSRDETAAAVGLSGRTYEKAKAVDEAAATDPEKFGALKSDMDRTGFADGAFKRLMIARQAENIRKEPPPLPGRGPYRVIVSDPPWPYELRIEDPSHRGTLPYPAMPIHEICAMAVGGIAHRDSVLWLWSTNHFMREAFQVLDAWGFQQKTILTWGKDRMGVGRWLRGQTEHCLLAIRGKPTVHLTNQTTLLHAPVRGHSRKPDEFYSFVEKLCPAPRYAELFQRTARPNWDGHGDEAPASGAEMQP